jgi:ferredoxin
VDTGCRAGTCGTCRCKKKKGVVVNVATGIESGPGEEIIYPCVSVARGTVEVEL